MKAVLSLLFLSILIFCVWSGYKKGLVMGIFSLIAFVVSVYLSLIHIFKLRLPLPRLASQHA